MDIQRLLLTVDHTLLSRTAVWKDIKAICDDGINYKTASVCIPPSFVVPARKYTDGRVKLCTVIGFPNGYSTTRAKCFEAEDAVENGADEIDMVIDLGLLKSKNYAALEGEINAVKASCCGRLLKVIIETCLLTDEEKREMCRIISASSADYIKTSTGFSTGGATVHDIELFKANCAPTLKIKAAGGISTLDDAEAMLTAGADRLGTSRIVKLIKEQGLLPPLSFNKERTN